MKRKDPSVGGGQAAQARVHHIATIDSELRSVAAFRRAARDRGGPLPLIDVGLRCWMNAVSVGGYQATHARIRDLETIDADLQLVVAFRRQARERGWPLPSIDAADALLDERIGAIFAIPH
jgi:hypothetical protein